tara:strand:- start:13 stop:663 length:651 start_codon:yes stop_codon:yes gene_type:complete
MDELYRILEEIARVPINIESRVNIVNPSFIFPFFLRSTNSNTDDLLNIINELDEENKDCLRPMCNKFKESLKKIKIKEDNDLSCAICQEKFKNDEIVIQLPCKGDGHYFHFDEGECPGLKPWIEINNTCPVCRTEFPQEKVIECPEPEPDDEPEPEPDDEPQPEPEPDDEPEGEVINGNIIEETLTNIVGNYLNRAYDELEDRELNEAIQRSLTDK